MISCAPKPNIHPPEPPWLAARLHVHEHYSENKQEDFHLARSARTHTLALLRKHIPLTPRSP
jgi:hypothetical protein